MDQTWIFTGCYALFESISKITISDGVNDPIPWLQQLVSQLFQVPRLDIRLLIKSGGLISRNQSGITRQKSPQSLRLLNGGWFRMSVSPACPTCPDLMPAFRGSEIKKLLRCSGGRTLSAINQTSRTFFMWRGRTASYASVVVSVLTHPSCWILTALLLQQPICCISLNTNNHRDNFQEIPHGRKQTKWPTVVKRRG